jgi:hypothetical protein
MKKLLFVFSLLTVLIGSVSIPALAQTASGKAVVPPFDSRYLSSAVFSVDQFFITNITSSPITVTITIYNSAGSMVTSGLAPAVGATNFVLNPGGSTASFTLAPNGTAFLQYAPTTVDVGYATVAWTQSNSTAQYGLIADVREAYVSTGQAFRALAVNNNMPF